MRSDGGPLDGGPLRVWLYSLLKRPANKRVLFSFCDVWSVPDSHFLFQSVCQQAGTVNGTPASGLWFPEGVVHVRPAYAWRYKTVAVGRRVLQDGKTKSNRRIAFLPAAAVPADP